METNSRLIIDTIIFVIVFLVALSFWLYDPNRSSIIYTLFVSTVGGVVWSLLTNIFHRKYNNKNFYLFFVIVDMTTVLILIFNQTVSPEYNGNKLYSYLIAVIFTLTLIWNTSTAIKRVNIYQKAVESYNKDLMLDSTNITLLNNKGTVLVSCQDFQEAMKFFDKTIELDPKDAAAWHNKGVVLDKIGKHKEALEHYDKALLLDPKFENTKKTGKIILEN